MNAYDIDAVAFEPSPEITTGRVVLIAIAKKDVPVMAKLANNKAIAENLATMPHPSTQQHGYDWLDRPNGLRVDGAQFGIYLNIPEPVFIGMISYGRAIKDADPSIGYWIGEPYWNQGYASEALMALLDHAFEERGENRMLGTCRITNTASRRVMEKCGFEYLGYGKSHFMLASQDLPVDCFALSRPKFMGLQIKRNGLRGE